MKRLLYEPDMDKLMEFQDMLASYAVPTIISTPNVNAVEAYPIPKCFPYLCVVNEDDYSRAKQIIRKYYTSQDKKLQATCPHCGDTNADGYIFCWSCDTPKDEI